MRHRLAALLCGLMFILAAPTGVKAIEIKEVVSPNGVVAWLVEDHSIPLVSIEFEFDGGAASNADAQAGAAYLIGKHDYFESRRRRVTILRHRHPLAGARPRGEPHRFALAAAVPAEESPC